MENPYKGLRAFQEADADDFFGRELLTQQLLDRMQEQVPLGRFLAVRREGVLVADGTRSPVTRGREVS